MSNKQNTATAKRNPTSTKGYQISSQSAVEDSTREAESAVTPQRSSGVQKDLTMSIDQKNKLDTPPVAFISMEQAARLTNISPSSLRRRMAEGCFKAVKCGRLLRINVASLEQYFASLPVMGAPLGALS